MTDQRRRIPVQVVVSSETYELKLRPAAKVNSSSTKKELQRQLQAHLGVGDIEIKGRGRFSEDGSEFSELSVDSIDSTVEHFKAHGGTFLVSHADVKNGLDARFNALGEAVATLTARIEKLTARVSDLEAGNENLTARVSDLEVEAAEFSKVALRYVVDEVHKTLERRFGVKPEQQLWKDYVEDLWVRERTWFKHHDLGFPELSLLQKGPHTPNQAGNDEAHPPQGQLVERVVLKTGDSSWTKLWNLVNRSR